MTTNEITLKNTKFGTVIIRNAKVSNSGNVIWGYVVSDPDFSAGEHVGYYLSHWTMVDCKIRIAA